MSCKNFYRKISRDFRADGTRRGTLKGKRMYVEFSEVVRGAVVGSALEVVSSTLGVEISSPKIPKCEDEQLWCQQVRPR